MVWWSFPGPRSTQERISQCSRRRMRTGRVLSRLCTVTSAFVVHFLPSVGDACNDVSVKGKSPDKPDACDDNAVERLVPDFLWKSLSGTTPELQPSEAQHIVFTTYNYRFSTLVHLLAHLLLLNLSCLVRLYVKLGRREEPRMNLVILFLLYTNFTNYSLNIAPLPLVFVISGA